MKTLIQVLNEANDIDKCTDTLIYNKLTNKILLIKRPPEDDNFPNKWSLPGGHRTDEETVQQGAEREVVEETGIELPNLIKKLCNWTFPDGFKTTLFYAIISSEPKVTLSDEHVAYKWVTPTESLKMDLSGDLSLALQHIYNELNISY